MWLRQKALNIGVWAGETLSQAGVSNAVLEGGMKAGKRGG